MFVNWNTYLIDFVAIVVFHSCENPQILWLQDVRHMYSRAKRYNVMFQEKLNQVWITMRLKTIKNNFFLLSMGSCSCFRFINMFDILQTQFTIIELF